MLGTAPPYKPVVEILPVVAIRRVPQSVTVYIGVILRAVYDENVNIIQLYRAGQYPSYMSRGDRQGCVVARNSVAGERGARDFNPTL